MCVNKDNSENFYLVIESMYFGGSKVSDSRAVFKVREKSVVKYSINDEQTRVVESHRFLEFPECCYTSLEINCKKLR
jgi:hypothetical protein